MAAAADGSFALYQALELQRDADASEIKRCYRRLAWLYHPDKGGDPERFKEISFAYEVLSDPERRAQYDAKGDALFYSGPPRSAEELREMLMRQGPGGRLRVGRSAEKFAVLRLSLEQLYTGCTKKLIVKRKVVDTSEAVRPCAQCAGRRNPLPELIRGACRGCNGRGKTWKVGHVSEDLEVYVPKGSAHGETILFRGKADEEPDCETGNLLVVLHEEEHPRFKRRGADLYMKLEISLCEALRGFRRVLQHLDGRRFVVVSTEALEVLERASFKAVKGQGMPLKGQPFSFGNLFLQLKVSFPTLDPSQRNLLAELVAQDGEDGQVCQFVDRDPSEPYGGR